MNFDFLAYWRIGYSKTSCKTRTTIKVFDQGYIDPSVARKKIKINGVKWHQEEITNKTKKVIQQARLLAIT